MSGNNTIVRDGDTPKPCTKVASRIPKFSKGTYTNKQVITKQSNVRNVTKCGKNKNDSSFVQLNITKVYFLKKPIPTKNVSSQENLGETVAELAKKISAICNKIKDVESCMFIGPHSLNTKVEVNPKGDVDILTNHHKIKSGEPIFTKSKNSGTTFTCDSRSSTKRHKNCLNTNLNTSKLFSSAEFSYENTFAEKLDSHWEKGGLEISGVQRVLDELSGRTKDIMKKVCNIDSQMKQIRLCREISASSACQTCRHICDELSEQKKEIGSIVNALKECLSGIPGKSDFKKQVSTSIFSFRFKTLLLIYF